MIVVRIIRWIAGVAGLGALTLGLLYWIAQMNFISMHMLFGLIVALSLLILGIVGVFTKVMRLRMAVSELSTCPTRAAETAEDTSPGELLTGEGDPGLALTGGSGHA